MEWCNLRIVMRYLIILNFRISDREVVISVLKIKSLNGTRSVLV